MKPDVPSMDERRRQLIIRNELFFTELLARIAEGKRPRIRPRGSSMLPFIRGGKDTVDLSALTEDSLQVGRIVLAHIPQGYLVHRIERIDGDRFTLRGDGNREQREYCTREQILAEVVEVQRGKRSIRPGDRLWWCYEHLWTKSPFWRRWILAVYRRTLLRWGF